MVFAKQLQVACCSTVVLFLPQNRTIQLLCRCAMLRVLSLRTANIRQNRFLVVLFYFSNCLKEIAAKSFFRIEPALLQSKTADFDSNNPLLRDGYIFDLVHQHELQHQETLAYLFHFLPTEKVQSPKSKVCQNIKGKRSRDKRHFRQVKLKSAAFGKIHFATTMKFRHKLFLFRLFVSIVF